jgi:hypothetical protein
MGNSISDSIEIDGCDMCRLSLWNCIFSSFTFFQLLKILVNYRKSDKTKMVAIGENNVGSTLPMYSGIGAVFTVSNDYEIIYCASAEGW